MKALKRVLRAVACMVTAVMVTALVFNVSPAQAQETAEKAEQAKEDAKEVAKKAKEDVTMESPESAAPAGNIVAVLTEEGNYTWLLSALERTGLDQALEGEGPFTLFAPNDEAVAASGTEAELESMDRVTLAELLRSHLLVGTVSQKQAAAMGELATVQGESLNASMSEDAVTINDATIIEADLQASNGVIHGIDAVLMGPAETAPAPDTGS